MRFGSAVARRSTIPVTSGAAALCLYQRYQSSPWARQVSVRCRALRRVFCKVEWKKLTQALATLLRPQDLRGRRVRLMFQDGGRWHHFARVQRLGGAQEHPTPRSQRRHSAPIPHETRPSIEIPEGNVIRNVDAGGVRRAGAGAANRGHEFRNTQVTQSVGRAPHADRLGCKIRKWRRRLLCLNSNGGFWTPMPSCFCHSGVQLFGLRHAQERHRLGGVEAIWQ